MVDEACNVETPQRRITAIPLNKNNRLIRFMRIGCYCAETGLLADDGILFCKTTKTQIVTEFLFVTQRLNRIEFCRFDGRKQTSNDADRSTESHGNKHCLRRDDRCVGGG